MIEQLQEMDSRLEKEGPEFVAALSACLEHVKTCVVCKPKEGSHCDSGMELIVVYGELSERYRKSVAECDILLIQACKHPSSSMILIVRKIETIQRKTVEAWKALKPSTE